MKKRILKVFSWTPKIWMLAVVFVLALCVALVPILRLAMYSTPFYDDYSFGIFARNFLELDRSIGSAIKGAIYCSKVQWHAWQGTYSASFLNSLMPAIWGDEYYFIGCIFLILFLPFSTFIFVKTMVRDILKAEHLYGIIIAAIASIMVVVFIYSPADGFYWYVGGMCYVGMHSVLMLLISQWIRLLSETKKSLSLVYLVLSIIGAFILGGGTYVSALQGIIVGFIVLFLGIVNRNKRVILVVPSVLCFAYGFYMNIIAPGNRVRGTNFNGYSPMKAVVYSFVEGGSHLWVFSGWMTIVIVILLVPIILQMLTTVKFKFKYPGLVLLGSFCLYATGFTPQLYAMGSPGLARTLNSVKITFQLLLLINVIYICGWLKNYLLEKKNYSLTGKASMGFLILIACGMLMAFAASDNKVGDFSSYGAYYFVHSGEAYNYYQEYLDRIETIKTGPDDVEVVAFGYKPWFLANYDLSEDATSERNTFMARWYNKNSIRCIKRQSE